MEYLGMSGYETRFEKDQDAEPNMIGAEYSGRGTHIEVGCEASKATVDIHENIFGEIESITLRVESGDEKAEVYLSKKLAQFVVKAIKRFLSERPGDVDVVASIQ